MASYAKKVQTKNLESTNYVKLVRKSEFQELLKMKNNFILPTTIFFLAFYFVLPILAAYTKILEKAAFLGLNWAWVYALMQFLVVWIMGIVYMKKARMYDHLAKEFVKQNKGELR